MITVSDSVLQRDSCWRNRRFVLHQTFFFRLKVSEKLIYPMNSEDEKIRYYLCIDELFPELLHVHQKVGHGGRDRMLKEIQGQLKSVSRGIVMDFLAGCELCEKKWFNKQTGSVVKPILSSHMNSRGQVDLIEMQSSPDGDYGKAILRMYGQFLL